MSVLFISYPDLSKKNGGSICTKVFMDIFQTLFSEVKLVIAKADNYAWDFSKYEIFEAPPTNQIERLGKIFCGVPHRYYSFLKNNEAILNNIDLVILSSSVLALGIAPLLEKKGIPFITIHHNYEPLYHRDNKTKISLWGKSTQRIFRSEDIALRKSFANIALTKRDINTLIKKHNLDSNFKISCVPAILESSFIKPELRNPIENKIVITGALHDNQTEDGILYFIRELLPILEQIFPNARVTVAGRNPSHKLKKVILLQKKIDLIENPDKMDEIVCNSMLYINPTRLGSGLKLRNADAFKYGCPVLAQRNACAGYENMLGKGLFQYNDKNDFRIAAEKYLTSKLSMKNIQNSFFNNFSFSKNLDLIRTIVR